MKRIPRMILPLLLTLTGCATAPDDQTSPMPPRQEQFKQTPRKPDPKVYLDNNGTLSIRRTKPKEMEVTFFPLGTSCASSSLYTRHRYRLIITPQGAVMRIEAFGSYLPTHSPIATADCGGAGIRRKTSPLNTSTPLTLIWSQTTLGTLGSEVGKPYCYSKSGKRLRRDHALEREYFRR